MLLPVAWLRPPEDFIEEKDGSVPCLTERNAPLAHHLVDGPRLQAEQLGNFLHVQKPWPIRLYASSIVHTYIYALYNGQVVTAIT